MLMTYHTFGYIACVRGVIDFGTVVELASPF